jgi:hypothetical protein
MNYVTPYGFIKQKFMSAPQENGPGDQGPGFFLAEQQMTEFLKLLLQSVDVDEKWYRLKYPDVADAIDDGVFRSAKHHFVESGYFEGRLPAELKVDEAWYAAEYEDVAEGVKDGAIPSILQHFRQHGYEEGRRPFAIV